MIFFPLSEGIFWVDENRKFSPANSPREKAIKIAVTPHVVVFEDEIILLDTGLGYKTPEGKMQLHENLLRLNIKPTDVTKVMLSHLHKDHAGGIFNVNQPSQLSCPNAIYYIQEREFLLATEKPRKSYNDIEQLKKLKDFSNVVFLSENDGNIDKKIFYQVTAAHAPYHQTIIIRHNDETIFYGGDDAPQLRQMKINYIAKYDYDGKKAMELRKSWSKFLNQPKNYFLFYHDLPKEMKNE